MCSDITGGYEAISHEDIISFLVSIIDLLFDELIFEVDDLVIILLFDVFVRAEWNIIDIDLFDFIDFSDIHVIYLFFNILLFSSQIDILL